jgi:hypothetical protein
MAAEESVLPIVLPAAAAVDVTAETAEVAALDKYWRPASSDEGMPLLPGMVP